MLQEWQGVWKSVEHVCYVLMAEDEHVKQPLINDTIDLVEPMEFDRRSFAEVLHRRVEKKSATGSAAGRQQLDLDLHAILKGLDGRKNCWFK